MKRTKQAILKCARWIAYCLEIGFADKSQINKLEYIWWQYHDENGNIKRSTS